MKKFLAVFSAVLFAVTTANAQKTRVYGVVKDASSAEPLISANVVYGEGQGVVTDFDGKYSVNLPNGDYTLQISYIGYESVTKKISAKGGQLELDFDLKTATLKKYHISGNLRTSAFKWCPPWIWYII